MKKTSANLGRALSGVLKPALKSPSVFPPIRVRRSIDITPANKPVTIHGNETIRDNPWNLSNLSADKLAPTRVSSGNTTADVRPISMFSVHPSSKRIADEALDARLGDKHLREATAKRLAAPESADTRAAYTNLVTPKDTVRLPSPTALSLHRARLGRTSRAAATTSRSRMDLNTAGIGAAAGTAGAAGVMGQAQPSAPPAPVTPQLMYDKNRPSGPVIAGPPDSWRNKQPKIAALLEAVLLGNQLKKAALPTLRPRAEVLIVSEDASKVLCIDKGSYILFPGGGIDEGETEEQGVVREAIEEADRKLLNLARAGTTSAIWPKGGAMRQPGFDGERTAFFVALDGGEIGTEHTDNEGFKFQAISTIQSRLKELIKDEEQAWAKENNQERLAILAGDLVPAKPKKLAELTLDIEKGDVLLGGRFKNIPMTVEEMGTDDLGQPTVNGRKLLAYRIKKKMPAKTAAEWTSLQNMEVHAKKHGPEFGGSENYLAVASEDGEPDAIAINRRCRQKPDGTISCSTAHWSPGTKNLRVTRDLDNRLVTLYKRLRLSSKQLEHAN